MQPWPLVCTNTDFVGSSRYTFLGLLSVLLCRSFCFWVSELSFFISSTVMKEMNSAV